jgi:hypothetical protein
MGDFLAHRFSLPLVVVRGAGEAEGGTMTRLIGMLAFAIESARDLIHYMLRRGQMGQEEAEVLIQ